MSLLIRLDQQRVMEMWPYLAEGFEGMSLDSFNMQTEVLAGGLDVFLSKSPRAWFFARPMHTTLDPNWRTLWVVAGWAIEPLSIENQDELFEDIMGLAKGCNCTRVLFNDDSKFLVKFLDNLGESLWQRVK